MATAAATELKWTQPKISKRHYELHADAEVLATMLYPSAWKSDANVTFAGETFVIRKEGFWGTRIVIRNEAGDEIASAKTRMSGGGEVVFANGRRFTFRQRGFFRSAWDFRAPDNELILSLANARGFFRSGATVTLSSGAASYTEIRVLIPLAWFLLLAAQQQSASAG